MRSAVVGLETPSASSMGKGRGELYSKQMRCPFFDGHFPLVLVIVGGEGGGRIPVHHHTQSTLLSFCLSLVPLHL